MQADPRKVEETIEVAARVDITLFDSMIILLGSLSLTSVDNKVDIKGTLAAERVDAHEFERLPDLFSDGLIWRVFIPSSILKLSSHSEGTLNFTKI